MEFKKDILICFAFIILCIFSLQSDNQTFLEDSLACKSSIEKDAFSILTYLSSFKDVYEKYLQSNKIEPVIRCKKCITHQVSLSEFGGSLVGKALKEVLEGKNNFEKTKLLLDGFLKVVSEGSCLDIVNYMISISNETRPICSYCHYDGHGDSWEKADKEVMSINEIQRKSGNFDVKNELSDLQTVVQMVKELSYYFDSTLKLHAALTIFGQKNNTVIPEITCFSCPKRSLPCDELLVKVQAKAMDKSVSKNNAESDEIRKKMLSIYDEIINVLYTEPLDAIRACMARIALDSEIQCEDCQKVEWTTLGIHKEDLYANDLQEVQKNNNSQRA